MIFRTPYEREKEYLLLDNTVGQDILLDLYDEDYFYNKGLYRIIVKSNNSSLPNFEYIEVWSNYRNDVSPVNIYYVSIYKPEFIVDAMDRDISDKEKEALYEYTSKYWEQIIDAFKVLYSDPCYVKEIKDFNPYKNLDIVWPTESPDYRLLPGCK